MRKITDEMLVKAARNAKHVPVRALDLKGLVFVAKSQSKADAEYIIRLRRVANGDRYGECTCVGFERVGYCKHLFSAVALVLAIKAARQRAASSTTPAPNMPAKVVAEEVATGEAVPLPRPAFTAAEKDAIANAPLAKPQHREVKAGCISI